MIAPVNTIANSLILDAAAVGEDVLAELVGKLYGALEAGGLLGRHFRYRSQVLRAVFRLVDREHGALLANIARVMLAVSPEGKVCSESLWLF